MASENSFQPRAVVPAAFGTVGLAFVVMAEEFLGYQAFGLGSWGEVDSYLVFCLAQTVIALALAVFAPFVKNEDAAAKPFILAVVLCFAAGLVVSLAGSALSQGVWALVAGLVVMAAGAFFAKVLYLLLLSEVSSFWSKRVLLGAYVLQSLFSPLAYTSLQASLALSAVCAWAGIACFAACWGRRSLLVAGHEPIRFAPGDSSPASLIAGLCVMMATLGFLNPLSFYSDMSNVLFSAATLITHLLAAVLFGICIFQFDDVSYVTPCKVALTAECAALLVYFAFSNASMFSCFTCAFVTSFIEVVMFYAMADYASYSSSPRLQVFGVYYCAVRASTAFGLVLEMLAQSEVSDALAGQAIGLVLGIALVVVALWVMTPEALNRFFWGATVQTTIDAAPAGIAEGGADGASPAPAEGPSKIERSTELISEHYGLTPREQEVLELFAVGRSATFIAEELTLSSNTVRKHIAHIYAKCEVHSKQELLTLIQDCPASLDDFEEKGEGNSA